MRLLDPKFKYIPSVSTNLHKTFARVRREMAQSKRADQVIAKVTTLNRRKS